MRLQSLLILMKFVRVFIYKLLSFIRTCRNILCQMISKSKVENTWNALSRSRKFVFFGFIGLVVLLYWWPSWLNFNSTRIRGEVLDVCIDAKLNSFRHKNMNPFDVIVKHQPLEIEEDEKDFVQYVGNGYIASQMDHRSKLYIKDAKVLDLSLNFYPVVQVDIGGYESQEGYVTNLRDGTVSKVKCFKVQDNYCVTSSQLMYAHRARPSILVQEFRIQNPSDLKVTVDLEQIGLSSWKDAVTDNKRAEQIKSTDIEYSLISGTHKVPDNTTDVYVIGIASMKLPVSVTVQATSTWSHHVITAVRYIRVSKRADLAALRSQVETLADEELSAAIIVNSKLLKEEHTAVWDTLWHSGFGISRSLAPGAINGDNINMTMYYVMSNTLSPIHDLTTSVQQKRYLEKLLYYPDRCYESHHTVQNEKMWIIPKSMNKLNELTKTWIVTLEVSGCATMLQAGADGAIQSMMLSIGGLQYKKQHLEFKIHPKDLHRDYYWRRLNYGNNTHLNLSVIVGNDNKALITAALDRNDKPYYACDAGCLDEPAKLSRNQFTFPVKLTEPLSPLLYITYDKEHMELLKHSIHVKEINVAPAHEHHVIAMHRHGHHFGGLPVLFWGSLGFLIIIFHLFLAKLIYNEYCVSPQDRYNRNRYAL